MEIVYWSEKVRNFKKNFDEVTAARVIRTVGLLEELGPLLDMPDSKRLGKFRSMIFVTLEESRKLFLKLINITYMLYW